MAGRYSLVENRSKTGRKRLVDRMDEQVSGSHVLFLCNTTYISLLLRVGCSISYRAEVEAC